MHCVPLALRGEGENESVAVDLAMDDGSANSRRGRGSRQRKDKRDLRTDLQGDCDFGGKSCLTHICAVCVRDFPMGIVDLQKQMKVDAEPRCPVPVVVYVVGHFICSPKANSSSSIQSAIEGPVPACILISA